MNYEFLSRYCRQEIGFYSPQMSFPFLVDGKWCASDSKHILVVNEELCDFTHADHVAHIKDRCGEIYKQFADNVLSAKPLNVNAAIEPNKLHATHALSIIDLDEYIKNLSTEDETEEVEIPTEWEECPCCDHGKVTLSESYHFRGKWRSIEIEEDCPICHGYGKVPKDKDYDPEEYDADEVAAHKTYETRKTGRKVISPNLVAYIDSFAIRASYLPYLSMLMQEMKADEVLIDFSNKHVIRFSIPGIIYAVAAMYIPEGDIEDGMVKERGKVLYVISPERLEARKLNKL